MTFDEFTNKVVELSLLAPTEKVRDAAMDLYIEIAHTVFEDSIEDAENFMKLFSK
jgi:hypothetical protein